MTFFFLVSHLNAFVLLSFLLLCVFMAAFSPYGHTKYSLGSVYKTAAELLKKLNFFTLQNYFFVKNFQLNVNQMRIS